MFVNFLTGVTRNTRGRKTQKQGEKEAEQGVVKFRGSVSYQCVTNEALGRSEDVYT